jgi:hypothetical protein
MTNEDLAKYKAWLASKLESVEAEKAQLVKKLRAIDILLEGSDLQHNEGPPSAPFAMPGVPQGPEKGKVRKYTAPAHAVRTSPRSSLIDAVREVAIKQLGTFDSGQLLKALQSEYPEFQLSETKHISSPLSDLVKKGVLVLEQKRVGSKSNVYRATPSR